MERSDIELGDAIEVKRRPRAGVVLSVRITSEEADRLQRIADERGSTVSEVARDAVSHFLTASPSGVTIGATWSGTADRVLAYGAQAPVVGTLGGGPASRRDPVIA
jgi:hypothetical protein